MNTLLLIVAFPLELLALFAIWHWRLRSAPVGWLVAGCTILAGLAVTPILLPMPQTSNIYLGFAGMYLFAALAWAWWVDGRRLREWKLGEVGVALMATAIFALANRG